MSLAMFVSGVLVSLNVFCFLSIEIVKCFLHLNLFEELYSLFHNL